MTQKINDSFYRSALASKVSYVAHCNNRGLARMHHLDQSRACNIVHNKDSGAHMYVYDCGVDSRIVAFRGTVSLRHAWRCCDPAMSAFDTRADKVKVHSHVLELFHSLESDLSAILMSDESLAALKRKTVTFCGHSAGGSLAQFAAAYYGDVTHGNVRINCHTLGAPRVGDGAFLRWYESSVTGESVQVVHRRDLVRLLPLGAGYRTRADLIVVDGGGGWSPWTAHDLDTYLETIEELFQRVELFKKSSQKLS